MITLLNFDSIITTFLQKLIPHTLSFDYFFSFFSLKGSSIFIWILVIALVVILEERKNPRLSIRDKKFIILFLVSFLLTALLSDIVFKNIFMRLRPNILIGSGNLIPTTYGTVLNRSLSICPLDFSFPSAHAATAFAAATILTFFDKKRKWFYYFVAVLISFSRIYLGCHYFFDVVVGAALGYIVSRLLLFGRDTFPSHKKS